jgi:regulator of protease activity HflC (stomatin/prohibitin superfamily)
MEECKAWKFNGFLGIVLILVFLVGAVFAFISQHFVIGAVLIIAFILGASGVIVVQPNQSAALVFFGRYLGSVRESGIWLTVPLCNRKAVSLKVRNFNSVKLKVNDVEGNPVEIAAVVVFKVVDSAKALFDVDDYEKFVEIQSETALRHVATKYPYDDFKGGSQSLRSNAEEVSAELGQELQIRLAVAGVHVIESRLTHLAYATEIASAMLQRQQATAIVSARQKIVEGAVGMAQMAIEQLQKNKVIELDEERKVSMINNLLVAIVSERSAQPVINTGNIYQ